MTRRIICLKRHKGRKKEKVNPIFVQTTFNISGLVLCHRQSSQIYFYLGVYQYLHGDVPDIDLVLLLGFEMFW